MRRSTSRARISDLLRHEPESDRVLALKGVTRARMSFADHHHCLALSTLFSQRGSRPVSAGQVLYTTEDPGDSVYFLRAG